MLSTVSENADSLPRLGRSTGILQHQSSFHTHTGTWRIGTVCPDTPDETLGDNTKLQSTV